MTSLPNTQDRLAFYSAAVLGLRALDARESSPRRFGEDAAARWAQFAGALGLNDRIDILLRDAVGTWGSAFSPSDCFSIFGLADDEPFGPDWASIDDQAAKRLLADPVREATLEAVADVLGVREAEVSVPALTPSTKLIVVGGAAVFSVAKAFRSNSALSWSDQVVVVAARPAWRQLAGLSAVLLGARGRAVVLRPTEGVDGLLRSAGFAHLDTFVISPDAEPEAAGIANNLGGR